MEILKLDIKVKEDEKVYISTGEIRRPRRGELFFIRGGIFFHYAAVSLKEKCIIMKEATDDSK